MNVALRGLTVLVGSTALVAALATQALATPASPSPTTRQDRPQLQPERVRRPLHLLRRAAQRRRLHVRTSMQAAAAAPSGYGPSSLQSAYALPSASAGSGQRVYIVDAYDDPNAESDLATYRSQYGLPACTTAERLLQEGEPERRHQPAAHARHRLGRRDLPRPRHGLGDLPATAASRSSRPTTPSDNLFTAVKEAATLGAKFVSMSWGGPEDGQRGQPTTRSTSSPPASSTPPRPVTTPTRPASSTRRRRRRGRGRRHVAEDRVEQRAAGPSRCGRPAPPRAPAPAARATRPSRSGRASSPPRCAASGPTADVSAVADPATGVAVYQTYGGSGWAVYGGTSASAPIIASVYALAGTPAATDQPGVAARTRTPATSTTSPAATTARARRRCCARRPPGWDGPTGLGTPNGTAAFKSGGGRRHRQHGDRHQPGQPDRHGRARRKSLQISASDSGGAALTYSATGLPTGLSINASSGLISGTPTAAGTYSVTVTAKDSTGASGSATFTWTISASGGGGVQRAEADQPRLRVGRGRLDGQTSGVINTDGQHAHTGSGYA